MKSIIGAAVVNFFNLSLRASSDSSAEVSAVNGADGGGTVVVDAISAEGAVPENWFKALINSLGSAPDNSLRMVELRIKMKYGTALTSNNSLISDKSSALMERNTMLESWALESANVLNTLFMVLHGPAQGVWKYKAINFEGSDLVSSVNCASDWISITPIL